MGQWVARQRAGRQQGTLTQDRMRILESIGFDFGDEAQMTGEWEERFDQLVEWLLWQARRKLCGKARQCCLSVQRDAASHCSRTCMPFPGRTLCTDEACFCLWYHLRSLPAVAMRAQQESGTMACVQCRHVLGS